jgi:DNA-binding protein Fis
MPRCTFTKKDGEQCKNSSRNDGLCKTHHNVLKWNEECPICYVDMARSKNRIKLECGHHFHKTCLSNCIKRECPMCRARFTTNDCYKIYFDTITRPLLDEIFNHNDNNQVLILRTIRSVLNIFNKSQWLANIITFFCTRLETTTVDHTILHKIFMIIDNAFNYVETNGVLSGFSINLH